jgi:hypothetical protein
MLNGFDPPIPESPHPRLHLPPPIIGEKPIDLARFIPSTAKVVGALARLSCRVVVLENEGYTVLLLYPNTTWISPIVKKCV